MYNPFKAPGLWKNPKDLVSSAPRQKRPSTCFKIYKNDIRKYMKFKLSAT